MSPLLDWHRLLIVIYKERALDSLYELLFGSYVFWGLYVWQGRNKLGVWGFLFWFPLLISATFGTALLLRRMTGPVAVEIAPAMYLYPISLLVALLTQPLFRGDLKHVAAYVVFALAEIGGFLWLVWLVVEPLLLQY